jgi:sporulation protein YlmC with PRC-barrel domain
MEIQRNTEPSTVHEGTVYTGHDVIDEQGNHVGRVTDVMYDDESTDSVAVRQPTWLVVDPGLLRAAHYMPVAGSYRTADGTIVTPWDKDWVKSAIKASNDHILTRDQRDELLAHYTMSS